MRFVIWLLVILLGAALALVIVARWRSPAEPVLDAIYRLIAVIRIWGAWISTPIRRESRRRGDRLCAACIAAPSRPDVDLPTPDMQIIDAIARAEMALRQSGEEVVLVEEKPLPDGVTRRYIVRTPRMRFPDTVTIRLQQAGAITVPFNHSISQLGRYDWGANKARVERIAAALAAKGPGEAQP